MLTVRRANRARLRRAGAVPRAHVRLTVARRTSHVAQALSTSHVLARCTVARCTLHVIVFRSPVPTAASYKFGPFVVDGGAYRLLRDGVNIPLSPKIIDLLLFLAARPSALVSKDDLFRALWPDVAVTDNALTQAVSELRQALGDDPAKPTYIQTVARRGYRFIAPVEPIVSAAHRRRRRRSGAVGAAGRRRSRVLDFDERQRRRVARLAVVGHRRNRDQRSARRRRCASSIACASSRPSPQSGRELVGAARAMLRHRSARSSAASSAPAIACASPRASSTPQSGEALADAKADGPLEQVFELQDRIVAQFADALGAGRPGPAERRRYRETSSLEAYQAFTEGRVRLESLDAARGRRRDRGLRARRRARSALRAGPRRPRQRAVLAVRDVARAQPARRGAAGARDRSRAPRDRARARPGRGARDARVPARQRRPLRSRRWPRRAAPSRSSRATGATSSAWRTRRGARNGCRRWRGRWSCIRTFRSRTSRRRWCTSRAATLDRAESVLREGTIVQDRQAHLRQRYPAKGCTGCSASCGWRKATPRRRCRSSIGRSRRASDSSTRPEFAMNAHDGAGFAHLATSDRRCGRGARSARRSSSFRSTRGRSSASARRSSRRRRQRSRPMPHSARASSAIEALRRGGRGGEATMAEALPARRARPAGGGHRRAPHACSTSRNCRSRGWTIPVEPLLAPLPPDAGIPGSS